MREGLSRGAMVIGGILILSTLTHPSHLLPRPDIRAQPDPPPDPRLARLTAFFKSMGSPLAELAQEFLLAADRYDLDWRLLPSISVVESSGGRRCRGNNIFGWDSGQQVFSSVGAAIHTVADRLANSTIYRNKDLPDVLETYNGRAEYAVLVQSVMERVDPDDPLAPVAAKRVYSSRRTPK
jgi:hypothetical protein